jgi:hypothetical protein
MKPTTKTVPITVYGGSLNAFMDVDVLALSGSAGQ